MACLALSGCGGDAPGSATAADAGAASSASPTPRARGAYSARPQLLRLALVQNRTDRPVSVAVSGVSGLQGSPFLAAAYSENAVPDGRIAPGQLRSVVGAPVKGSETTVRLDIRDGYGEGGPIDLRLPATSLARRDSGTCPVLQSPSRPSEPPVASVEAVDENGLGPRVLAICADDVALYVLA